uniref:Uncharacterized protein n=1 Tax=Chrysotila carterae TaxID=13221 RepID=A0A7S4BHZ6_CHRCT
MDGVNSRQTLQKKASATESTEQRKTKEASGRGLEQAVLCVEESIFKRRSTLEQRRRRVGAVQASSCFRTQSTRTKRVGIAAPTNKGANTARGITPATKDGATNIAEATKDSNDTDASMGIDV